MGVEEFSVISNTPQRFLSLLALSTVPLHCCLACMGLLTFAIRVADRRGAAFDIYQ